MARSSKKPCVYCGKRPGTTSDHPVPRCLFPPTLPTVVVTVPSCRVCNEATAKDDDYLRDMMAIDIANCEHPAARAILSGPVSRAARRNQSISARDLLRTSRAAPGKCAGFAMLAVCRRWNPGWRAFLTIFSEKYAVHFFFRNGFPRFSMDLQ